MAEDKEKDEQLYIVQSNKMKMVQREKSHGKKQEVSYCYIDLLEEEEMQVDELGDQKRDKEDEFLVKDSKECQIGEEQSLEKEYRSEELSIGDEDSKKKI